MMNQKLSWPISSCLKFFNSEWRKQIESAYRPTRLLTKQPTDSGEVSP
jgi:hypothetical protein